MGAEEHRWTVLVSCLGLLFTSGSIYLFPAFSTALGGILQLSVSELAMIAAAGNVGQYLGVIPGIICDRWGSELAIIIGAFLGCFGWGMFGLATDNSVSFPVPKSAVALMIYNFILAQGSSLTYVGAVKAALKAVNFKDRPAFVGLTVCFFALSAGFFGATFKDVFEPLTDNLCVFFYSMASFLLAFQCWCSFRMWSNVDMPEAPPLAASMAMTRRRQSLFAYISLLLCFQLISSMLILYFNTSQWIRLIVWVGLMVILSVVGPLRVFVWPVFFPMETTVSAPITSIDEDNDQKNGSGFSLVSACASPDLYLVLINMGAGLSFGLTVINNLATIVASVFPFDDVSHEMSRSATEKFETSVGALLVLFSTGNASGRLLLGALAEATQKTIPRPAWFLFAHVFTLTINIILLLFPVMKMLFFIVPCAGVAAGFHFAIGPLATADLFGVASFGSIWGIVVSAPCFSAVLVAGLFAGHFADSTLTRHTGDGNQLSSVVVHHREVCRGVNCYKPTWIFTACILCLAIASSSFLTWRCLRRRQQQKHG